MSSDGARPSAWNEQKLSAEPQGANKSLYARSSLLVPGKQLPCPVRPPFIAYNINIHTFSSCTEYLILHHTITERLYLQILGILKISNTSDHTIEARLNLTPHKHHARNRFHHTLTILLLHSKEAPQRSCLVQDPGEEEGKGNGKTGEGCRAIAGGKNTNGIFC